MCCAPCTIYPVKLLREKEFHIMGFFYRHNIHPYTECLKRQETLKQYAEMADFRVIWQPGYELTEFIRNVVFRETNRCAYCYYDRLKTTALLARRGKFDYFTSTLLYSKFQQHDLIRSIGESLEKTSGVRFFYSDFREGWKEGIAESKRLALYRQEYCGCIYSEMERYYRPLIEERFPK
jgi:predicted adenine nucleotide alpha hydrolase (AANH) superfamily ATPase